MRIVQFLLFLPICAAIAVTIGSGVETIEAHKMIAKMQNGEVDALQHAGTLLQNEQVNEPLEWIETANTLSALSASYDDQSLELLERALAADPSNPNAWALFSFLQTRRHGEYNAQAEQALQSSFELCGYCEPGLLRWRLTYVLQHWPDVSEEARLAAFSGADFLRWWHLEYDYLAQVRNQARAKGIPFDLYRRKIGSPVRPNEIGL